MAPGRHPGCPGAAPANVRGHSTPITLATGERFSPTRFSLTGAHSIRGIHPQRSVHRAAKRKTLYVIMREAHARAGAAVTALDPIREHNRHESVLQKRV